MVAGEPVRLVQSQIREAGDVLARAFHDDPLCIRMTPDDAKRARALPCLMTSMVRYYYPFATVYTTMGAVEGVAVWAPPGHAKMTLGRMLAAGLLVVPLRFGLAETMLFMSLGNSLERYHEREVPSRHWYLVWLGVDPPSRGRGVGSALLQPVLSRADDEGLPCYLQNSKAVNLAFYRRHGFEVVSEFAAPKGGPPIWTMRREPRR